MSTTDLTIPPSRVAGVVNGVIDSAHRLTRPVFVDVENVPAQGPFMLVGNHQLLGMQDLPSLVRGLEVERGVRVRGLADRFHFAVPLWRSILTSCGAVLGTRENCAALLAAGEPVLVFPGGAGEVYKRRNQSYQLLWGDRTGFARMAIAAGCPIVPFGGVGAEDRFQVLVDTDQRVAAPVRALMRRVAGRNDVGTLLVRGSGPLCLPRLDRLYFRFGAPIATTPWAGRADDPQARAQCRDLVKAEVEAHIDYLLSLRDGDPQRPLLPRVVDALRTAMSDQPQEKGS
jgi:1-acyl-sn-glycerol-3-phosphate acyltransferase